MRGMGKGTYKRLMKRVTTTLTERIDGLRRLGYDDEQIVDVLVHAAEPSLKIQEAPLRELLARYPR